MGRSGQPGQTRVRLVNPEILGSLEHVGRAPSLSARPDHGDYSSGIGALVGATGVGAKTGEAGS